MSRDVHRGRGHWRGCYSFKGIICDDSATAGALRRNGGLKMGATYYYYYELDGSIETFDPTEPSTTACPYLPGQTVNTLSVPVECSSRQRRASQKLARRKLQDDEPKRKIHYATPEPSLGRRDHHSPPRLGLGSRQHFPQRSSTVNTLVETFLHPSNCLEIGIMHLHLMKPWNTPFLIPRGHGPLVRSAIVQGTCRRTPCVNISDDNSASSDLD